MTEWMQFPLIVPVSIALVLVVLAYIVCVARLIRSSNNRCLDCLACFGGSCFFGLCVYIFGGNFILVTAALMISFPMMLWLDVLVERKQQKLV